MAKPTTVKVTWNQKSNEVKCRDEVVVYFDTPGKADSVVWVFDGEMPADHTMKIAWDVMSPFFKVSRDLTTGGILGTWNNEEAGVYDYSVLIVNTRTRQVVAGFDPKIRNEPPPIED
jgi:hypothetical protein